MFELRFIIRILRATSAWAKQPEIGKTATFSDGRVICQFVICVEAHRKEQRGGYCYVQTLPEALITGWSGTGVQAALEPRQRATRLCICK